MNNATTLQTVTTDSNAISAAKARRAAKTTQRVLRVEMATAEITKLIKGGCKSWNISGEGPQTVVSVWGDDWAVAASVAI